jgi:hypothetical protein
VPRLLMKRVGRALVPWNSEAEAAMQKLPEGRCLRAEVRLPRSGPAHRMFFAVVAAAALHWPHDTEPNPEGDAELLRAWLLVRAGHRDVITFPLPDAPKAQQIMVASVSDLVTRLRARGEYTWIRTGEVEGQECVRVYVSRSMDFDNLDEAAFAPIRQHAYDDIESATGVRVDDLVRETEAAA